VLTDATSNKQLVCVTGQVLHTDTRVHFCIILRLPERGDDIEAPTCQCAVFQDAECRRGYSTAYDAPAACQYLQHAHSRVFCSYAKPRPWTKAWNPRLRNQWLWKLQPRPDAQLDQAKLEGPLTLKCPEPLVARCIASFGHHSPATITQSQCHGAWPRFRRVLAKVKECLAEFVFFKFISAETADRCGWVPQLCSLLVCIVA